MTVTVDPTFWNQIAERYAKQPLENPGSFERKIEVIRSRLRPTDTVLDVGCGTGSLALRLAPFAAVVHGLDVSMEMVRIARGKQAEQGVENVTFHTGALDETFQALPAESVDLVCACSLLHLVDDRDAVLTRLLRQLRPGGTFVSSTVCLGNSWVPYAPLLAVMRWLGKAPPVLIFPRDRLVEDIRRAGFVEIEAPEVGAKADVAFLVAKRPAAASLLMALCALAAVSLPGSGHAAPGPEVPPAAEAGGPSAVEPETGLLNGYRFTLSTPYLTLTNFDPDAATLYELHLGFRLTPRDTLAIKAVTWKLVAPLGIPWGPYLANESENYPGSLRETGVGLAYQRFLVKGLYASVQVVPLVERYLDEDKNKVDDSFRLYTSYHVGYYLSLFQGRVYVEPQVHWNYWPIQTAAPPGFSAQAEKWDNDYFLFEPNLMLGFNFGRKREDGRFVP